MFICKVSHWFSSSSPTTATYQRSGRDLKLKLQLTEPEPESRQHESETLTVHTHIQRFKDTVLLRETEVPLKTSMCSSTVRLVAC